MSDDRRYWKVLRFDNRPIYGTSFEWSLPKGKRPGVYTPIVDWLNPCSSGWHLTTDEHLLEWLGPNIYEAEPHPKAKQVEAGDKVVFSRVRLVRRAESWDNRNARMFAAECAERVLHIYEERHPNDDRPRQAIHFARLRAGDSVSYSAACSAAYSAACSAASSAARSAARSAVNSAAYSAAHSAADSAGYSAACSAASSAAHSAADSAAYSAAGSAASSAAYSAACSAADSAACSAACSAERQWQNERLLSIVTGEFTYPRYEA